MLNNLTHKREIETKAKQFLLNNIYKTEVEVLYTEFGKPYLKKVTDHISVSHSLNKLVVLINKQENCGVDIEQKRNKISTIKHKFLNDDELNDCENDIEKQLIYWTAKETLYKIYGFKELDFIKHIRISPFYKKTKGVLRGTIKKENFTEQYQLEYVIFDDYILTYSLRKIC